MSVDYGFSSSNQIDSDQIGPLRVMSNSILKTANSFQKGELRLLIAPFSDMDGDEWMDQHNISLNAEEVQKCGLV